jgi:hypothetical protein
VKAGTAGLPAQHGTLVAVPRLDHDGGSIRQAQALAARQHAVLAVALAGHPDPALQHGEFAAAGRQAVGAAGRELPRGQRCRLRIHHQSP